MPFETRPPSSDNLVDPNLRTASTSGDTGEHSTSHSGSYSPGPVPSGYEILGELGRGGMGVVYKARHHALNRTVALKMVLNGGHASATERSRLLQEAAAAASLQHPNIVQVYEVGEHDGLPYFTQELVEGGSLARYAREPLAPEEAAQIVEQIARGVAHAHEQGIVHRDLKPENILLSQPLSRSGGSNSANESKSSGIIPKVSDFGLAKHLAITGEGLTKSGAVLGTPSYMAPEQARGDTRHVGPPADVWALGAVLYRLLTGRPPFHAVNPLDTVIEVLTADPVAPSILVPKLPRDLETIVLKCLQKDEDRRYASATDLADDLSRYLSGEPILARPVGRLERTWKWVKRNRTASLIFASTLLLAVAVTAGSLWFSARLATERTEKEKEAENARRNEKAAIANLRLAGQAVDDCFKLTSEDPLLQGEAMQPVRGRLYAAAGKHYRQLVETKPDDPELREDYALNLARLGRITNEIGTKSEALTYTLQALEEQQALYENSPANSERRSALADTLNFAAGLKNDLGQPAEAVEWYQRAIRLLANEPASRFQLASAYSRAGTAYRDLTENQNALSAYETAARIQEELLAENPNDAAVRRSLASTQDAIGHHHHLLTGRFDDCEKAYRRSITLYRELLSQTETDARVKNGLANVLNNLGILLFRIRNQPEAARECYVEAVQLAEELSAAYPAIPKYRDAAASPLANLSNVYRALEQPDKVRECLKRVHTIYERAVASDASVTRTRIHAGLCLVDLGDLDLADHKPEEARQWVQQGLVHIQFACQAEPKNYYYQNILAYAHETLAKALRDMKQYPESRDELQKAIAVQTQVFKQLPNVPKYRDHLSGHYLLLAEVALKLPDVSLALDTLDRLTKLWPTNAENLFEIAQRYAECSRIAKEGERGKAIEQTLITLESAVQAGFWNSSELSAFDWPAEIKNSPRFAELQAIIKARQEPAPAPRPVEKK